MLALAFVVSMLASAAPDFAATVVDVRPGYQEVRFPSPLKSRFASNNTVWGHFYLPEGKGDKKLPCILVLPVMAAPNLWIEERFVKRFVEDGFAVFLMEGPYQFHRRVHPSQPSGQVFLGRTASSLAFNFKQSAADARRSLDWLEKHPRVDAKRIGLFGVSLGGMVSASVYSTDKRPRHAVFLLSGADFPGLARVSSMTRRFMEKAGIAPEELRAAWKGIDPLDYADRNGGKSVLLINARWDKVVPRANAEKLRAAFPGSRQEWVSGGHYSAIAHLFWIPRRISRDFAERL
jgi:dipeptidyl aminopeptidase/acylaminoacyl peptidase